MKHHPIVAQPVTIAVQNRSHNQWSAFGLWSRVLWL